MASNTEIEKLERRWLENPLGLTFATLAEAYRKAGNTPRALEVLELGLAQHPNYVPAHIVRGRCHFDAQANDQAEAAFLRVLELDRENVIALKGLAELSERSGRLPEAIERLSFLIEIDRNNEEARGQLDRVRELLAAQGESPASVAPAESSEAAAPEGQVGMRPAEATAYQIASDAESLSAPTERIADILLSSDSPILESGLGGVDGLLGGDYASLIAFAGERGAADQDIRESGDQGAGESEVEVEPVQEPIVADVVVEPEPEPEPAPTPEPIVAMTAEPIVEVIQPPPAAEPVEEPVAVEAEQALVVTETMAEVFLRQGHRELALAVYQQLALRDPLNERIAEAVGRLTPEPPAASPEPEPEPIPIKVYAAAETGGPSVGDLLGSLFKATRPSVATTVHPPAFEAPQRHAGEPTRPSEEMLSLRAVFGDEAGPAGPASMAPSGEPSFDEFFAPATGASADAELPKPPGGSEAMSAQVPEDLEQFNAWLRGLKR